MSDMQAVSAGREIRQNSILSGLSIREYEDLSPHLETVELNSKYNLYNYGDVIEHVYFPLDVVFCLFTTLEDGATVESGVIGSEGVLGVSTLLGSKTAANQVIATNQKKAVRVRADILKRAFETGETLRRSILQYFHALYLQVSQTAACNRHHNIECRLSRWLLMMHDRSGSDELHVTQEFIAEMLGTRRPYVTTAAGLLHKQGIIECSRGQIKILDRRRLEDCCCECYKIIRESFNLNSYSVAGLV